MIDRSALRQNTVTALRLAATDAQDKIFSPRDWATWRGDYPVVIVRTPLERKESKGRNGPPQFDSVVTVQVVARVERATEGDAETDVEALARQIEDALLRNDQFITANEIQQFVSVETRLQVSADGEQHLGEAVVAFGIEVYQLYEPAVDADGVRLAPPLTRVDVHLDTAQPFDPSGSYPAPTEPPYVPGSPPRTSGPDGRDEGALTITLPQ